MVGIPKGTRDFGPEIMVRRNYIFSTIRTVFERYGYLPLETPSMENLSTLTGKYGEEGDQLIFRILNSGDNYSKLGEYNNLINQTLLYTYEVVAMCAAELQALPIHEQSIFQEKLIELKNAGRLAIQYVGYKLDQELRDEIYLSVVDGLIKHNQETPSTFLNQLNLSKPEIANEIYTNQNIIFREIVQRYPYGTFPQFVFNNLTSIISKKANNLIVKSSVDRALRYDLTVPFARYVVMNHNQLAMPFKRYQIQPVWRADRPQKGRYREFYQCDADVVGSNSLLNEVELIQIFDDVLSTLGIENFSIKINNRKLLTGLAEVAGISERMMEMTIAIDKLDKIGLDGVKKELLDRGFTEEQWNTISSVLAITGSNQEKVDQIAAVLNSSVIASKGVEELNYILKRVSLLGLNKAKLELDLTLARGLNYYTGTIFEVKANDVQMGSICGGGRYDDLTGIFGLPGLSGVGISFGADRIYDVMMELQLFPASIGSTTKVLFTNFGEQEEMYSLSILRNLRAAGINAEIYPESAKMKKQFKYADDKKIPFVAIVGEEEMNTKSIALKNMTTGEQITVSEAELTSMLA